MPAFLVTVFGALAIVAAPLIARIMLSLGIGVVSYIGMGVVLDYLFDQLITSFNTLPAQLLHLAALMKMDVAVNIIFGAVNARLGLMSLNGIVTRFSIDPSKYSTSEA